MTDLKQTIIEHGQYRDVSYITKDGEIDECRCLVVPAREIEPILLSEDK